MTEFEPRRAFEHVDKLAYEIGPRLAGTRGDRMAAEYIKNQLESYGLNPQTQTFTFVDVVAKRRVTACVFAAALIVSLFLSPLFSLLTWLVAMSIWRSLGKLMPKRESQNIIAGKKVENPRKSLAITAHYDSAPCLVHYRLHLLQKFTFIPVLSLISIVLISRALGLAPAWPAVWTALAFVFFPVCVGMFVSISGRRISPGANDNASGVAVMLETARVLAEAPPEESELRFIAFGAEEQGLVGARNLVKKKSLPPDTLVLNLDMVGAGSHAYIIEGNGVLRRTRTSARLNKALLDSSQRVGLRPRFLWAALAGHDHVPILRAKIQATTFSIDTPVPDKLGRRIAKLFKLPNARVRGYRPTHTPNDMPDRLELDSIEHAGNVVLDFVKTV